MNELGTTRKKIISEGFRDWQFSISSTQARTPSELEELKSLLEDYASDRNQMMESVNNDLEPTLTHLQTMTVMPGKKAILATLRVYGTMGDRTSETSARDFMDSTLEFFDRDGRSNYKLRIVRPSGH